MAGQGAELAEDTIEELDQDGIGGGGVVTESRPAVFGTAKHAEDVKQPAWMRVGLSGPVTTVRATIFLFVAPDMSCIEDKSCIEENTQPKRSGNSRG